MGGQLSRERRRCEPRNAQDEDTAACGDAAPKPKTPSSSTADRSKGAPRAASSGAQSSQWKHNARSSSSGCSLSSKDPPTPTACVAELERRLWHTQRALDKERRSHEETREALISATACHSEARE